MKEKQLTTTVLHADRRDRIEHGAIHKPIHVSTEYAYDDARELAAVFQGKPGYTYARQGTPTTAALENKISLLEQGKACWVRCRSLVLISHLWIRLTPPQ